MLILLQDSDNDAFHFDEDNGQILRQEKGKVSYSLAALLALYRRFLGTGETHQYGPRCGDIPASGRCAAGYGTLGLVRSRASVAMEPSRDSVAG